MKRVMAVILSACLCLGGVNFVWGDENYSYGINENKKNEFTKNADNLKRSLDNEESTWMTQLDINEGTKIYREKWNSLLEEIFDYLKYTLSVEDFNDLSEDELKWNEKKKREVEMKGKDFEGGSAQPCIMNMADIEMTSDRVYYLISLIEKTVEEISISVILNGKELSFDQPPYIENGTTMVPMRAIFEALGASVNYDTETKAITATKGSTVIKLFANSDTATVNGKEVTLMSPVANKNGTTMVPLRLVSEALGAEVSWDAESKTINISISEKNTKEETSTIKLNELDETYSGEIYDYEKNYIEAHQKFINSDDYKNITSYACAEEIGNGIKNDSKIQNAKLGNHAVHLFKDYFKNYYDIALADVLIKQSTYDKYELMFKDGILKNQKSICDDIINIVKDDWGNDFSKKDESIIRKILTTKNTEDYANDPIYTKLSSILEKHMNQEQITNIFNATGKVSNAVELFNKASNIIDAVQNTMNYSSALNAYLDTSDEFKKVLVYTDINPALKYKNGVDYALLHESINRYLEIYNEENVAKEVANKALYEGVVATYSIFKDEWINSIGNFIYTSAAISGSEAAVSAAVGKVTGAITIGYEIGTAISDVLFKNNEKVALLSTLEANGFLAENAKKALDSAESEFLKNPSYENAKIFDEAFNFYKGIQIYSCDKAIEYDKQIKGLLNIFKWKSLDENIKFAEETKKEYEDLYCH